MENNYLVNLNKTLKFILLTASMSITLTQPAASNAFPVYAQQAYENPREATGRIVCATVTLHKNL